jgi:hypothetical protein
MTERFCKGNNLRSALTSASVIGSELVKALLAATVVLKRLPNVGPNIDSAMLRDTNLEAGALMPRRERSPTELLETFSTVL